MKMIKEYNRKYITFKKGSISTIYQEFEAFLPLEPKNRSLGEELRRTLLEHFALNYLSKRVRITFENF